MAIVNLSKKYLSILKSQRYSPLDFFRKLYSFLHLVFVNGVRLGSRFIFLTWISKCPAHLLQTLYFPSRFALAPLSKIE